MCKDIIKMIPEHKIYVEPYFGGGAVFFAKYPSPVEVINDHNDKLITFYKQVLDNFDELQKMIQKTLCSESEWLKARRIYLSKEKDEYSQLEIAWSFWVLCNMSYSGSPNCGWKWDNASSTAKMINAKRESFTHDLQKRLSLTQISCRDAITVIEQRDSKNTFFYLDPPYVGCNQQHYKGFTSEDFSILLTTLEMIKGKFILSHFWNEQLRDAILQCDWNVKEITTPLTVARNCRVKQRSKTELLVYNYQIEKTLFDL